MNGLNCPNCRNVRDLGHLPTDRSTPTRSRSSSAIGINRDEVVADYVPSGMTSVQRAALRERLVLRAPAG
jgi:hypothetical protein